MAGKHKEGRDEQILDPDLPIVDAHHHLFIRPGITYMFQDYLEDAALGHNIRATVYEETKFMSRPDGPEVLRPLGEVEFANGMAAMAASGFFGECRLGAAIVGHADLTFGAAVGDLFDRCLAVAPDRFRGIRQITMEHPDPAVMGTLGSPPKPGAMRDPGFALGLRELAKRGLSFDATVLDHQLPDLTRIAAEHEDLTIVLCHMGLAVGIGKSEAEKAGIFRDWRARLADLARYPNVRCKVGGLGTLYWDFGFDRRREPVGYLDLAEAWAPYVQAAIDTFGPDRCMMESDFPPDGRSCGFVPLWNAMKHITRVYSAEERAALFHGTAIETYRIGGVALNG